MGDFAEAGRAKRREAEVSALLPDAKKAASGGGDTETERLRLEDAKRKAVAEEDFAEAAALKKQLAALSSTVSGNADEVGLLAWGNALSMATSVSARDWGPAVIAELRKSLPDGISALQDQSSDTKAATAPKAAAE